MTEMCRMFVSKLGLKREIDVATLLNSKDGEDRARALSEIGFRGYAEYFELVVEMMLSDPITNVRAEAARALDKLNDSRAFSALVKAIHDPSFSVRSAAGWALVHLGEELVCSEMEKIRRESDNDGAREMALLVLQNLWIEKLKLTKQIQPMRKSRAADLH